MPDFDLDSALTPEDPLAGLPDRLVQELRAAFARFESYLGEGTKVVNVRVDWNPTTYAARHCVSVGFEIVNPEAARELMNDPYFESLTIADRFEHLYMEYAEQFGIPDSSLDWAETLAVSNEEVQSEDEPLIEGWFHILKRRLKKYA